MTRRAPVEVVYEDPDKDEPDEYVVEPAPERRALPAPRDLPAPRGRRTPSAELVRGRRVRVRRGQMLVPVGPTPAPTREVPAPLPPMEPIDLPQPEQPNTAAERARWKTEYPHGASADEQRRAVDQFVVDLQYAVNDAWHARRFRNNQSRVNDIIEENLRDMGYRPSVIEDFRDGLREREGQLRVRRMLNGARRWRHWALALKLAVDGWL